MPRWVRANVLTCAPSQATAPSRRTHAFKLRQMPCLLSSEQRKQVSDALSACEQGLGELEVDGLFVGFVHYRDQPRMFSCSGFGTTCGERLSMAAHFLALSGPNRKDPDGRSNELHALVPGAYQGTL